MLGVAQRQPDRDQPLLRAVVQVALDPAALLVAGGDDPRPRGLDLGELAAQLDAQPRDLDRQPAGLDDARAAGRDAAGAGGRAAPSPSGAPPRSIGVRARVAGSSPATGTPARVDVELALGQEEAQLERRVGEQRRAARASIASGAARPARRSSRNAGDRAAARRSARG